MLNMEGNSNFNFSMGNSQGAQPFGPLATDVLVSRELKCEKFLKEKK